MLYIDHMEQYRDFLHLPPLLKKNKQRADYLIVCEHIVKHFKTEAETKRSSHSEQKINHLDVHKERLMAVLAHGGDTCWSLMD